ncbi:MAG: adenylyl-sulfate kinase, partial [Candidatus Brocadiae bacterium]|nr:adenylyl-sulfate kinase [Candidatus Brocadiia bacterium]
EIAKASISQGRRDETKILTIAIAHVEYESDNRHYAHIDCPGHADFIKNMITGASQAEAAILVCSVAEGVQEQTRRHAYLVKLLGLEQVVVAYNKMDLVDYDRECFRKVRADMNEFLARIGIKPAMEVPVSARCGDNVAHRSGNMPWYDGPTVVEALDVFEKIPPPREKPLRFPVQDVYEGEGDGGRPTVVGRVESGVMKRGQRLRFLPDGGVKAVLAINQYGREDMTHAEAGECIGVVLDGAPARRGQVGCPEDDAAQVTDRFRANIFWLSPTPLALAEQADALTFKCATQKQPCRIVGIRERMDSATLQHLSTEDGRLEETEVGEVVIETPGPVVLESFYDVQELGRFVLVRGREVAAGGMVSRVLD